MISNSLAPLVLDDGPNTVEDPRSTEIAIDHPAPQGDDYRYIRIETTTGEMAWSSPLFAASTRN